MDKDEEALFVCYVHKYLIIVVYISALQFAIISKRYYAA